MTDLRRVERPDGMVGYRSPLLTERGVPHWFTTRIGPGGGELCMSRLRDDERLALAAAAGKSRAALVHARQVHGDGVVVVEGDARLAEREADALVARTADTLVYVYTADCVPVLLAADGGTRVAAVHAGWKGILAGAIPRTLERLESSDIVAAIGPCLSRERCEMGPEVIERFLAAGLEAACEHREDAKDRVDVRLAARIQLERAGLTSIDVSDRCTWEHEHEFHSHRRDVTHGTSARAGRLGALIGACR